jgi:hypothetical protein
MIKAVVNEKTMNWLKKVKTYCRLVGSQVKMAVRTTSGLQAVLWRSLN